VNRSNERIVIADRILAAAPLNHSGVNQLKGLAARRACAPDDNTPTHLVFSLTVALGREPGL